jgi:hypothetical protein
VFASLDLLDELDRTVMTLDGTAPTGAACGG